MLYWKLMLCHYRAFLHNGLLVVLHKVYGVDTHSLPRSSSMVECSLSHYSPPFYWHLHFISGIGYWQDYLLRPLVLSSFLLVYFATWPFLSLSHCVTCVWNHYSRQPNSWCLFTQATRGDYDIVSNPTCTWVVLVRCVCAGMIQRKVAFLWVQCQGVVKVMTILTMITMSFGALPLMNLLGAVVLGDWSPWFDSLIFMNHATLQFFPHICLELDTLKISTLVCIYSNLVLKHCGYICWLCHGLSQC